MSLAALQGNTIPRLLRNGMLLFTDTLFLALSYEGEGLDEVFEGVVVPSTVEDSMVAALRALHQQGVTHGDVRLANFVSSDEGHTVRLIDLERSHDVGEPNGHIRVDMDREVDQVQDICNEVDMYDR